MRAHLWMPVLTAVRKNPWLHGYDPRLLARDVLPTVALVGAMRTLLVAVYTVAEPRRPFVPVAAEVPP